MRVGYAPEYLESGSKYADDYTEWSEWSTIMVTKTLANTPTLDLNGTFVSDDTIKYEPSPTPLFVGKFTYDGEEYLDKYRFILMNQNKKVIESSDWV